MFYPRSWRDLTPFGIGALTGESCSIGMRILCDVSKKGVQLLNNFFGGNIAFKPHSNWNSMVGEDEAVASVMLPYSIHQDLTIFAYLQRDDIGAIFVDARLGDMDAWPILVVEKDVLEEHENDGLKDLKYKRKYVPDKMPGYRNRHAMSGRLT